MGEETKAGAQRACAGRDARWPYGSAEHVRWIQENGRWYHARSVDYQFEAEHLTKVATEHDLAGLPLPVVGLGEWEPITIQEIHNAAAHNPRLTMYIPDRCGPTIAIGADESPITPGLPSASVPK